MSARIAVSGSIGLLLSVMVRLSIFFFDIWPVFQVNLEIGIAVNEDVGFA